MIEFSFEISPFGLTIYMDEIKAPEQVTEPQLQKILTMYAAQKVLDRNCRVEVTDFKVNKPLTGQEESLRVSGIYKDLTEDELRKVLSQN